jgi:hypothetical protein
MLLVSGSIVTVVVFGLAAGSLAEDARLRDGEMGLVLAGSALLASTTLLQAGFEESLTIIEAFSVGFGWIVLLVAYVVAFSLFAEYLYKG